MMRDELAAAINGLVYSSESDRPFAVFFREGAAADGPLDAARVAALAGAAEDDVVEEQTLDRFFARHIDMVDPLDRLARERLPRYEALKRLLTERLSDVRVYRIGRVRIRCLAVGRDDAGNVVGVETVAIET
jgi:hypothetical protein